MAVCPPSSTRGHIRIYTEWHTANELTPLSRSSEQSGTTNGGIFLQNSAYL